MSWQRSPTSWSLTWRAEALNQTPSRRPTPLAPNLRATPSEPAGARKIPDVWQPFKGPFTNLNPAKSTDAETPCWFWRGYRPASPSEGGQGVKDTFRCLLSNLLSKMVMWWIASKPVERASWRHTYIRMCRCVSCSWYRLESMCRLEVSVYRLIIYLLQQTHFLWGSYWEMEVLFLLVVFHPIFWEHRNKLKFICILIRTVIYEHVM